MAQVVNITYQLKRGYSNRWLEVNPILKQGEPGFEIDTGKLKIGNGINTWTELDYIGDSVVINVNTRSNLPDIGNVNNLYRVLDEKIIYQWNGNSYEILTLRLRRDNAFNYDKIKDTFVPANGEICLVDTPRDGLRAVCGDGVHTFGELDFIGEVLVRGYYYNGNFYSDNLYTNAIDGSIIKIYIDLNRGGLYYFDGEHYQSVSAEGPIPTASSTTPGIMKLYDSTGNNTDGTMTQKAITDELNEKVEISLNLEEETLIFSN